MATTSNDTKRVPAISAEVVGQELTLTFANGEVLRTYVDTLSPEIQRDAMLHGLKAKLVDAAAIARNTDTGRSATIDDKYDAVKVIFDRITSANGTWNQSRGDGTGAASGLLVRAIMQLQSKPRATVEAFLEAKTKEQKAALRANPKIAAIIASMQAAASKVDSDELLSELE